jgi:hypothetical protein
MVGHWVVVPRIRVRFHLNNDFPTLEIWLRIRLMGCEAFEN